MKRLTIIIISFLLTGCLAATAKNVRQSDLDAWVGVPVKALDVHPMFLTMRLERSFTEDGLEIRNYVNEGTRNICTTIGYNLVCKEQSGGCHNIFYIHDGYVMEYRPTGAGGARCYTDERTRPQGVW